MRTRRSCVLALLVALAFTTLEVGVGYEKACLRSEEGSACARELGGSHHSPSTECSEPSLEPQEEVLKRACLDCVSSIHRLSLDSALTGGQLVAAIQSPKTLRTSSPSRFVCRTRTSRGPPAI